MIMLRTFLMILLTLTATADAAYYLHFIGGANWMTGSQFPCSVDYDTGFYAGAAGGYNFRRSCSWYRYNRFEVEYTIRKNQLDSYKDSAIHTALEGSAAINSWMVNVYQDIPWRVGEASPYLGGGIGYSYRNRFTELEAVYGGSDKNNGFTWQLIAGFSLPVNVAALLDVEYRFFASPGDLYNHSLGLGLRYLY